MSDTRPGRSRSRRTTPSSPPRSSATHSVTRQLRSRDNQNDPRNIFKKSRLEREYVASDQRRRNGTGTSSKLGVLSEESYVRHESVASHLSSKPDIQDDPSSSRPESSRYYSKPALQQDYQPSSSMGLASLFKIPSPVAHSGKNSKSSRQSIGERAQQLAEIKTRLKQRDLSIATDEDVHIPPADDDWVPPSSKPVIPTSSGLRALLEYPQMGLGAVAETFRHVESQARQRNKENIDTGHQNRAFIDRQKGATRIPWNSNTQEASSEHPDVRKTATSNDPITDEDDEDDFQAVGVRNANKRRKILQQKTASSSYGQQHRPRRSPQQSLFIDDENDDDNDDLSFPGRPAAEKSLSTRRDISAHNYNRPTSKQPPPSTQSPPLTGFSDVPVSNNNRNSVVLGQSQEPPVSTAQNLEELQKLSQRQIPRVTSRPAQVRTAYTADEEERLTDLIELYGISYSYIQRMDEEHPEGPRLAARSQVQLKDKAQELKFQFLRDGVPLPTNFEKIPLRKRLQMQLES